MALTSSNASESKRGGTTPAASAEKTSGLKEALAKGVTTAVATLGKENGLLKEADVKIPPGPLRAGRWPALGPWWDAGAFMGCGGP